MDHQIIETINQISTLKKSINFSFLRNTISIIFFRDTTKYCCKGIVIEKKKCLNKKQKLISLKTLYLFQLKYQEKIRLGHIVRQQIVQKTS